MKYVAFDSKDLLTALELLMQEYLITMEEKNKTQTDWDYNKTDIPREHFILNKFFLFVKNESKYKHD